MRAGIDEGLTDDGIQRWVSVPTTGERTSLRGRVRSRLGRLSPPWSLRLALATIIAGLGPTIRNLMISPAPRWIIIASISLIAVAALDRPGRSIPRRAAVVIIATAAAVPVGGFVTAIWLAMGLVLVDWLVWGHEPLSRIGEPSTAAAVVTLPFVGIATVIGSTPANRFQPLLITGAAFVLAAPITWLSVRGSRQRHRVQSAASKLARAVRWAIHAIRTVVGVLLSTVLFGVLWLPFIFLPWLVHRLSRVDPLGDADGWLEHGSTRIDGERMWSRRHTGRHRPRLATTRLIGAAVVLLAIGLLGVRYAILHLSPAPQRPIAMRDAKWWDAYDAEVKLLWDPDITWNLRRWTRVHDFDGRLITVEGGYRVTEQAFDPDVEPLRVWIYGGSTTFGIGQRNERTIASNLSRIAWEHGIPLEVHNRGVNGDTHFDELVRLSWEVTDTTPPDMVVFYDGVNDLGATIQRNSKGFGDLNEPESLFDDLIARSFDHPSPARRLQRWWDGLPPLPHRDAPLPSIDDPVELARRTVRNYDRAHRATRSILDDMGIPVLFLWQPSRWTRNPQMGNPEHMSMELYDWNRANIFSSVDALPADVVDLTDAFDHLDEAVYTDDVHTNELGARVIAERIFDLIEPWATDSMETR